MKLARSRAPITPVLWLVILCMTAWAYWPGLAGPPILDDLPNLLALDKLELSRDYASDVATENHSGLFGRPVSMASFVLERLYFDFGTRGQKTVGVMLHCLSATVLLLLSRRLAGLAGISSSAAPLAVAALWLAAPLLLSTTLYAVQRMTLLSGLFSLLSLLSYTIARQTQIGGGRATGWFALILPCLTLSVLSKENGLLTVPLITVIELYFFRFAAAQQSTQKRLLLAHGLAFLLPVCGVMLILVLRPEFLFASYAIRDFGPVERILSEALILIDYVRQVLWVDVHRLGVYHDDARIVRSLSGTSPVAMALLLWLTAILFAGYSAVRGRYTLLGFAVAFFLVGHAMESTVLPLELYFEHRNYLPAAGLLMGLVLAGFKIAERFPWLLPWLQVFLLLLFIRSLLLLGSQAVVWSDNRLLHLDALANHPNSERAALQLGQIFATDGNLAGALALLNQAPGSQAWPTIERQLLQASYHCLSGQELPAHHFDKSGLNRTQLMHLGVNNQLERLVRLSIDGYCTEASSLQLADAARGWIFSVEDPQATPRLYANLLLLENELERYPFALEYATLLVAREPKGVMGLQFMLYLATLLEDVTLREQALQALLALEREGKLNRQESDNLALFLPDPGEDSPKPVK